MTKKKFKDTKVGKALKGVVGGLLKGAVNVALPDVTKFFDRNQDGKVDYKDLAKMKWFELLGAVGMIAALIKLEIIDLEVVVELIKLLLPS